MYLSLFAGEVEWNVMIPLTITCWHRPITMYSRDRKLLAGTLRTGRRRRETVSKSNVLTGTPSDIRL